MGGFLNVTFRKAVFTLYCIEVLETHVPDTITTDGDSRFADYLSCNNNHDHADPRCSCDSYMDRYLSKTVDQAMYCKRHDGTPCEGNPFEEERKYGCKCECPGKSLEYSANFTGMMPVYHGSPKLLGYWYSHPNRTECGEHESVGQIRKDGSVCTWKRMGESRVLRGGDALENGWNVTPGTHYHKVDPAQVEQNTNLMRRLFNGGAFQQWRCEDAATDEPLVI